MVSRRGIVVKDVNWEGITPESSARICNHMNQDHMEAVDSYVRNYGNLAKMTNLSSESIEITIKIPFPTPLRDVSEARQALKDLIK